MADDPVDDFRSSLADLTFNSKPLINMLTMLAEENAQYAEQIVRVIEEHIRQVSEKNTIVLCSVISVGPKCSVLNDFRGYVYVSF